MSKRATDLERYLAALRRSTAAKRQATERLERLRVTTESLTEAIVAQTAILVRHPQERLH